jgi:hypothetical protein
VPLPRLRLGEPRLRRASGTAKEVSGQAILKFDLRMSLTKASGNHKDFHLHVVFSFVFFVNFVVKHYPQDQRTVRLGAKNEMSAAWIYYSHFSTRAKPAP